MVKDLLFGNFGEIQSKKTFSGISPSGNGLSRETSGHSGILSEFGVRFQRWRGPEEGLDQDIPPNKREGVEGCSNV